MYLELALEWMMISQICIRYFLQVICVSGGIPKSYIYIYIWESPVSYSTTGHKSLSI